MSSSHQSTLPAMPSASLSSPSTAHDKRSSPPSEEQTRPAKRRNLTAAEQQAKALERLSANPVKAMQLPKPVQEKTLRPPKEMMKNVGGSSAGAGSGEFHVYKHARRREYERIKLMEEAAARDAEKSAFEEKHQRMQQEAEAKTSKNRAKRDKKKMAKLRAKHAQPGSPPPLPSDKGDSDANEEPTKHKRIHAEGAAHVVFSKPDSDEDSE